MNSLSHPCRASLDEAAHGVVLDTREQERRDIESDYSGLLAHFLQNSHELNCELSELIADDRTVIASLLKIVSIDGAHAGLMLTKIKQKYCEHVERDMLESASRSVIEEACEQRVSDDEFQAAEADVERFIRGLSE